MTQSTCAKGHIYDSDTYASCPYCNGQVNSFNLTGAPGDIGRTAAIPGVNGAGQGGSTGSPGSPETFGATVPLNQNSKEQKVDPISPTQTTWKKNNAYDPVVGWLVAIEGPEKGKSFSLYAKINSVGRDEKNDVCLRRDLTISGINQMKIAYDEKHNAFYLINGDSTKNTNYRNGEPVYSQAPLAGYDVIEAGETKLIFVPFCCDRFRWDNKKQPGVVRPEEIPLP